MPGINPLPFGHVETVGQPFWPETLIVFTGTPTTPDGREARDAMSTRMATAKAARDQIIVDDVVAKVFQGGGERFELNLVAKVEVAADAALDRLFRSFKTADDNRWTSVINRAKNGDEAAQRSRPRRKSKRGSPTRSKGVVDLIIGPPRIG